MGFEEVLSYEKGFWATIHSRKTGFELRNFWKIVPPARFLKKKVKFLIFGLHVWLFL